MLQLKKIMGLFLCMPVMLGLIACSSGSAVEEKGITSEELSAISDKETAAPPQEAEDVVTAGAVLSEETKTTEAKNATLVVVFSATGTTKGIADKIVEITGADLYEITAYEPYTDEDREYKNSESRCAIEQNDASSRPVIGSEPVSLDGYSTIYIGYPIWFSQEPRIMDTFVESYDFSGKTVIPFCTSGSSSIGESGHNLASLAGTGNWLEGARFAGDASFDEIKSWIDSL